MRSTSFRQFLNSFSLQRIADPLALQAAHTDAPCKNPQQLPSAAIPSAVFFTYASLKSSAKLTTTKTASRNKMSIKFYIPQCTVDNVPPWTPFPPPVPPPPRSSSPTRPPPPCHCPRRSPRGHPLLLPLPQIVHLGPPPLPCPHLTYLLLRAPLWICSELSPLATISDSEPSLAAHPTASIALL